MIERGPFRAADLKLDPPSKLKMLRMSSKEPTENGILLEAPDMEIALPILKLRSTGPPSLEDASRGQGFVGALSKCPLLGALRFKTIHRVKCRATTRPYAWYLCLVRKQASRRPPSSI